jgi:hypothetical protein
LASEGKEDWLWWVEEENIKQEEQKRAVRLLRLEEHKHWFECIGLDVKQWAANLLSKRNNNGTTDKCWREILCNSFVGKKFNRDRNMLVYLKYNLTPRKIYPTLFVVFLLFVSVLPVQSIPSSPTMTLPQRTHMPFYYCIFKWMPDPCNKEDLESTLWGEAETSSCHYRCLRCLM